jgi:CPA2 family monovalent cation:H+ antiporter-2
MILLAIFGIGWKAGLFTGCLVALSSTTIVLTVLVDQGDTGTPAGQQMLGILIFQDLAIIAMALVIPLLSGEAASTSSLLLSMGQAIALVGLVLVLARKIIPYLFEKIAATGRNELFVITVTLVCLGTAWVMSLAGVSLALGAFMAGLVVSESRYSSYALSEVLPFRTVFNAIFFVSVGMLLDLGFVLDNIGIVLLVAGGVLVVKALITGGAVLVLGYPARMAVLVGVSLAQIGEFSFVLERVGATAGLTPAGLGDSGGQIFIAVTVLLMMLTPLMMSIGKRINSKMTLHTGTSEDETQKVVEEGYAAMEDHALIVGYGRAGQQLVHILKDTHIPFVVIEINPDAVKTAEADRIPIVRGDAVRPHILEAAGLEKAKLCVLLIDDAALATRRIVELVHYFNPTIQIITRTRYLAEVEPLHQAGADIVVPEELETSIRIFSHVLGAYMISPQEITNQLNAMRSDDYKVFRGSMNEAHMMVLQGMDEEGLHTRAVIVRKGARADSKTLGDLDLRGQYGLTVLAVRRDDRTIGNPSGTFQIQAGDRLVMIGTAAKFYECATLFRESEERG